MVKTCLEWGSVGVLCHNTKVVGRGHREDFQHDPLTPKTQESPNEDTSFRQQASVSPYSPSLRSSDRVQPC